MIAEPPAGAEPDVAAGDEPSSPGKPDAPAPGAPAPDEPVPSKVAASVEPAAVPEPVASAQLSAASQLVDPAATLIEPEDSRFDAMFGATVTGRRPEDAAVRSDDDVAAAEPKTLASMAAATVEEPCRPDDDRRRPGTAPRRPRRPHRHALAAAPRPRAGIHR